MAVEPAPPGAGAGSFPRPKPQQEDQPKLAIAATFTAEPLEETLRFWMRELTLPMHIGFAPYNQLFQQLIDRSGLLGTNHNGLNVVLIRLEDLALSGVDPAPTQPQEAIQLIERNVGELLRALKGALAHSATPWLVLLCPASRAALANPIFAGELTRLEQLVTTELSDRPSLSLVTPEELFRLYPALDYDDPRANRLGHVPFTPSGYAALATLSIRKAHALRQPARKVVAIDCDQTLWAGVCGEDGARGVQLDPARTALQQFLLRQFDLGMLLCLCSKNNEPDVAQVFRQRREMPLGLEHIAAQRINWRPKSENLRSLAQELKLGLDSFILLDDNPMECAEVEANCPEVLVLHLPKEPAQWRQFLEHVWAFDHARVTEEDRQRNARYQQNRLREELEATAPTLQSFLAGLELRVLIEPARPEQLARVSQLTQRTNQFNCTTRRRSEEEIAALQRGTSWHLLTVTVTDRFGEYGLVGALIFERRNEALVVDTFLLSCRVLGKGVEHRILAHLGLLAQQLGASRVDIPFVPSARNQPALDFLSRVGGAFRQDENGGSVFRFPAGVAAATTMDGVEPTAPDFGAQRPTRSSAPTDAPAIHPTRYTWVARAARDPEQILKLIEGRVSVRPPSAATGQTPPQTEVQRRLCAIWQEILKVERIGIRDDFFELGGTSQLAVRLCARIEKQLGRKLPLAALFKGPTIEQLATKFEQA